MVIVVFRSLTVTLASARTSQRIPSRSREEIWARYYKYACVVMWPASYFWSDFRQIRNAFDKCSRPSHRKRETSRKSVRWRLTDRHHGAISRFIAFSRKQFVFIFEIFCTVHLTIMYFISPSARQYNIYSSSIITFTCFGAISILFRGL